MADIKNYQKEKEKRTNMARAQVDESKEISYRDRIRQYKRNRVYRVIALLLVLTLIGVIAFVWYQNLTYENYDVVDSIEISNVSGANTRRLNDCVLTYSKDGAHLNNERGQIVWNQTYEMQSPMLAVCQDVVAVADYNGREIYVYNTEEKLGEISTTMPIKAINVSAKGMVAAVLEDGDVTWIRGYGADGKVLLDFKTTMKNYGYPISLSLSPSGILCAVSYAYVDMGEMKSSVAFYNFGEVGQNKADNFVGGHDYADTLVPYVQFMNDHSVFAVGDDRLVFYSGSQKPENVQNVLFTEELQAVYYNEEYVGLVFLEGGGDGKRLDIYNEAGQLVRSHSFDMDYIDIMFEKDTFIIYSDTHLYISRMNGKVKYDGLFKEPASLLVPTGNAYRYLMVTKDSIEVIRLR